MEKIRKKFPEAVELIETPEGLVAEDDFVDDGWRPDDQESDEEEIRRTLPGSGAGESDDREKKKEGEKKKKEGV